MGEGVGGGVGVGVRVIFVFLGVWRGKRGTGAGLWLGRFLCWCV